MPKSDPIDLGFYVPEPEEPDIDDGRSSPLRVVVVLGELRDEDLRLSVELHPHRFLELRRFGGLDLSKRGVESVTFLGRFDKELGNTLHGLDNAVDRVKRV